MMSNTAQRRGQSIFTTKPGDWQAGRLSGQQTMGGDGFQPKLAEKLQMSEDTTWRCHSGASGVLSVVNFRIRFQA